MIIFQCVAVTIPVSFFKKRILFIVCECMWTWLEVRVRLEGVAFSSLSFGSWRSSFVKDGQTW